MTARLSPSTQQRASRGATANTSSRDGNPNWMSAKSSREMLRIAAARSLNSRPRRLSAMPRIRITLPQIRISGARSEYSL
jgi:hypothetical protein